MDEIGNMSLTMQVKSTAYCRKGKSGQSAAPKRATWTCAFSRRQTEISRKRSPKEGFRANTLLPRLSVIPIQLPPLRERRDDIPLLARHFLETFRKVMEKPVESISPEAMSRLESYDWPGNVRELENTMERAVALETTGEGR